MPISCWALSRYGYVPPYFNIIKLISYMPSTVLFTTILLILNFNSIVLIYFFYMNFLSLPLAVMEINSGTLFMVLYANKPTIGSPSIELIVVKLLLYY